MTDTLDHLERSELPERLATEWVRDSELIRRSGVPEKKMRRILQAMDADPKSGFPKKDKFWGDRRHWPSVQDYWKQQQQRKLAASQLRRA